MNIQVESYNRDEFFITVKEVCRLTTLAKSQIYRLEAAGGFPKRVVLGPGRVAWANSEVIAWMEDKKQRRAARSDR
jgi:predicted DNA-binding transcriptional regulator AlpA